jgi:sugar lactone lactonase YvrE
MSILNVRRLLIAAALLAISGCTGTNVPSSLPAHQGARSQPIQPGTFAHSPSSMFVHTGVPFLPRESRRISTSPAQTQLTYPTTDLLLFEGDQTNNQIAIYKHKRIKTNSAPIATITDAVSCPAAMVFDKNGTLYVANQCGANTITEYPKGRTTHSATITRGVSNPLGLAIDKNGTLYVSNYPAAIKEYPFGSKRPSVKITGGGLTNPFGLSLDKDGNLYVADFGARQVFEIAAGTTTVVPLNLQDLSEPLGVACDKVGNLWVTDGSGDKVNVYPPGSTTPSHSITTGYSFPYAISIDKNGGAAISNINTPIAVYAYKRGQFTSYATLTNDIALPISLLLAIP